MRKIFAILIYLSTGCHTGSSDVSKEYANYKFDSKVIENLPLYDSLVSAILEKSSFFQQHMDKNESYRAYKYMPNSDQDDVYKVLPKEIAPKINNYYTKLGKEYIIGFDVFKDSTIKIYIRNRATDELEIGIEENLSYYPSKTMVRRRELPIKDTLLNEHWQYWIRFNKRRFF